MSGLLATGGPVIPNYGNPNACLKNNGWFCTYWIHKHWHDILQPALIQHIQLVVIAVAIGFAISFPLAVIGYRLSPLDPVLGVFSDFLYTVPSIAFFLLLVPLTGVTVTTVEVALVSFTLFIFYRNIVVGLRSVPPDVLESARGMGMTRRQRFWRVELPLARPAIFAGLRIATVATISIATLAAFLIQDGLGAPIFDALGTPDLFHTELLTAGGLAVLLALTADLLLGGLQRALTPWTRVR
jgi:osmoprotectant transport system permease protein